MVRQPTSPRTVRKLRAFKREHGLVHDKATRKRVGPPGRRFYTWGWNAQACLGAQSYHEIHPIVDKPTRLDNCKPINQIKDGQEINLTTRSGRTVLTIADKADEQNGTYIWSRGAGTGGQLGAMDERGGKRVFGWKQVTKSQILPNRRTDVEFCHPAARGYSMTKNQDYVEPKNYIDVNWPRYAELVLKESPVFFDFTPAVELVGPEKRDAQSDALKIQNVFAGHQYTFATPHDGAFLLVWGSNTHGQQCMGATSRDEPANRRPHRPMIVRALPLRFKIAKLGLGRCHVLAVGKCGRVFGWGDNKHDQLGWKNAEYRPAGTRIAWEPRLIDLKCDGISCSAVDAVAGESHSVILLSCRSRMLSSGSNELGQLGRRGLDKNELKNNKFKENVSSENASGNHSSTLFAPVSICLTSNEESVVHIEQIVAGRNHAVALVEILEEQRCKSGDPVPKVLSKPKVVIWGDNSHGQLGLGAESIGTIPFSDEPTVVANHIFGPIAKWQTISDIHTGDNHTLVRTKDGSLCGWGSNTWGQLLSFSHTSDRLLHEGIVPQPTPIHIRAPKVDYLYGRNFKHEVSIVQNVFAGDRSTTVHIENIGFTRKMKLQPLVSPPTITLATSAKTPSTLARVEAVAASVVGSIIEVALVLVSASIAGVSNQPRSLTSSSLANIVHLPELKLGHDVDETRLEWEGPNAPKKLSVCGLSHEHPIRREQRRRVHKKNQPRRRARGALAVLWP